MTMIGVNNYLQYANKNNKNIVHYEGILIYSPEFGPSRLPQEVLFMPQEWNREISFEDFLLKNLNERDKTLYQVYFQGVRWIIPDLESELENAKFISIKIGDKDISGRATYAKLSFEQLHQTIGSPFEVLLPSIRTDLKLVFKKSTFKVGLIDAPESIGVLKLYQAINW